MKSELSSLPWWQRGVIYQIYPRSFQDSNGDGVGDLNGIIARLDYLDALGIDAIWISPFYPSPMKDFGYDVSDYCDVDPLFGDLAAFDRLVAEAHHRKLKVIIDWVPNHTTALHPWIQQALPSPNNPKRDWYIWSDPRPDGSPPNNWGSAFGGPAWTLDPATGQYYLHQFVKEQPELNWRNPQVVEAMLETLRFWMRRGVDGFRMDVVGMIHKDPQLRDNPLNPNANPNLPPNDLSGRQFHVYNADQDDVHPVIRRIRQTLDEFSTPESPRVGIGELWGELPRWVRYYGQNGDELQLPFNFRLIFTPFTAQAVRRSVDELEAVLPDFAWPNYVLGNHDQPRLVSRVGGQPAARLAAVLLLTLRGTPTLYYGDEIGMANGKIPPEKIVDPQGKNLGAERSRDVARTPMQWDASPNAGFTSLAEPWLPTSADYTARNVAAQQADPHSMLALHRGLLSLRRSSPALYGGTYQPLPAPPDGYLFLRTSGAERKLVALNFSDQPLQVAVPANIASSGSVLLSTHLDREGPENLAALSLRPFEGVVFDCPLTEG